MPSVEVEREKMTFFYLPQKVDLLSNQGLEVVWTSLKNLNSTE